MEFPNDFLEMPGGPYLDVAAIHLRVSEIARLLNVALIVGEEDPGKYERIFFRDGIQGFVLTSFLGFEGDLSIVATNLYENEISNILFEFFEKVQFPEKYRNYLIIPAEREIMLYGRPG